MNHFEERQHLMQNPMMWLTIPGLLVVLLMAIFGKTDSQGTERIIGITIVSTVFGLMGALLLFARLETRISEQDVQFRWFPFQIKFRSIPWSDIKTATVRNYSPLTEYGGWGIKGFSTKNRAYNISGDIGLQLELHSGKKILIGTRQKETLEALLYAFRQKQIVA